MKIIITESQVEKIHFLRRMSEFEKHLNELIEDDNPCWYDNKSDFVDILLTQALMDITDYDNESEMFFSLMKIVTKLYSERLRKIYADAECDD